MESALFTNGMERTMNQVLKERLGEDAYKRLAKEAVNVESWEDYDDLIRPMTVIGWPCPDDEEP